MPEALTIAQYKQAQKKLAAEAKRQANILKMIRLNQLFQFSLRSNGIEFVTEYEFDKFNAKNIGVVERGKPVKRPRRWRADYYFPQGNLVLEIEGGAFTGGRHTRGAGFVKDIEKYNALTIQGIKLLRCIPSQLNSKQTLINIKTLCAII